MESADEARKRYDEINKRVEEMARADRRKMGVDENDPFAMTDKMIQEMESAGPEWTGSEQLRQILECNRKRKESLEASRKRKRYHSPAEGMTKAEIWECTTGERLTDEEVQAKIDAIHVQLGDHPTLARHWEYLTGEKLTEEQVQAKIDAINKKLGEHPTLSKHWEVLTGEKLTDEQVEAKIKASYQLPRNPAALV